MSESAGHGAEIIGVSKQRILLSSALRSRCQQLTAENESSSEFCRCLVAEIYCDSPTVGPHGKQQAELVNSRSFWEIDVRIRGHSLLANLESINSLRQVIPKVSIRYGRCTFGNRLRHN